MKNTTALTGVALMNSFTHDASEDFILPEYMPPIRRIVSVDAVPLPETRFFNGNALELGGTLALSVVYIGEDSALTCASLATDYTASCAVHEGQIPDATKVGTDTSVENVNCRVSGPRSLTIRVRMKTHLLALEERTEEENITAPAGEKITPEDLLCLERLTKKTNDTALTRGEMTADAAGQLSVPAGTKVIRAGGTVRIEEVRAASGEVQLKGEFLLHALCVSPEGQFTRCEAKEPIAETVAVPDAKEGDAARAWGRCASVTVQESTTEESGGLSWEAEIDLEAECARPAVCEYTADLYATHCRADVDYEDAESLKLIRCGNSALSVSGEAERQIRPQETGTVIDAAAVCSADRIEVTDGKVILHGTAAASVLIALDGDAIREEVRIPFRSEVSCDLAESGDLLTRTAIEAVRVNARQENGKLAVNAELCISMLVLAREKIRRVRSAVLNHSEKTSSREGKIRICYPAPGESMWEIAKRYAVPRASLGEAEFSDGSPMIV